MAGALTASTPRKAKRKRKHQRWHAKPRASERVAYRKKLRIDPKKARKIVALWEAVGELYSVEEFADRLWDEYGVRVGVERERHCEMVAAVISQEATNGR